MQEFKHYFENKVYGVCSALGRRLNMPTRAIRLFFIYTSVLALGSPIILYLILAFIRKLKTYVNNRRNPVWDF